MNEYNQQLQIHVEGCGEAWKELLVSTDIVYQAL